MDETARSCKGNVKKTRVATYKLQPVLISKLISTNDLAIVANTELDMQLNKKKDKTMWEVKWSGNNVVWNQCRVNWKKNNWRGSGTRSDERKVKCIWEMRIDQKRSHGRPARTWNVKWKRLCPGEALIGGGLKDRGVWRRLLVPIRHRKVQEIGLRWRDCWFVTHTSHILKQRKYLRYLSHKIRVIQDAA